MFCQEWGRERAGQMMVGCLWWRIFLAMVCLMMECEEVELSVALDWVKPENWS